MQGDSQMAEIILPKSLPDCELLRELVRKVEKRTDTDFTFINHLETFFKQVSDEIRQINALFPEYTPHDANYHLKHLFHIADTIIGLNRYEVMNSGELFLLALGLCGHDWGMAVSITEKEFITTGRLPEGVRKDDLWILPNDEINFNRMADENGVIINSDTSADAIPLDIWQNYIRETHSMRSAERVRRYFEHIDGGIADAASRICEAHWLEFDNLQDYVRYPSNFTAIREAVNLCAIAVYVRLIDLLDLGEDRTPYIIWKFVAPRDKYSKMEWAKHRSLREITCVPYQEGRIINVDGSTDDHNVYAALQDLRIYCEGQLRGCNDVLARLNDPRHQLDIFNFSWRINPRGFEPISIQFEFDRERMFEILSAEIYQNNIHVFLRELLQNSIDAIRMRRAVLKKYAGIDPGRFGEIKVNIEPGINGDIIITWADNGIGMDEYVVRNYLAIAGKSYYRSKDFERENLNIDPISKFGIGILSCFVVAERIEIETFKDPNFAPKGNPLKIIIPDMRRQFRIEKRAELGAEIGTFIKVFIKNSKLNIAREKGDSGGLAVTDFLKYIAGFVEFPILIEEGTHKTAILHPDSHSDIVKKYKNLGYQIHQISMSYPWSEVFLPQDLTNAKQIYREIQVDVSKDLTLGDCEGKIIYLAPITEQIDFLKKIGEDNKVILIKHNQYEILSYPRTKSRYVNTNKYFKNSSMYSLHSRYFHVFRDGILLPNEAISVHDSQFEPSTVTIINLSKSISPNIDLARTVIIKSDERVEQRLKDKYIDDILKPKIPTLLCDSLINRFAKLGRIMTFHSISEQDIIERFPNENIPMLMLNSTGELIVKEWNEISLNPIFSLPNFPEDELALMIRYFFWTSNKYHCIFNRWRGVPFVINNNDHAASVSLGMACLLTNAVIGKSHIFGGIQFVRPPWRSDSPLLLDIWMPLSNLEKMRENNELLKLEATCPQKVQAHERWKLWENSYYTHYYDERIIPHALSFPAPFKDFFAYGLKYFNSNHIIAQSILKIRASLKLAEKKNLITAEQTGRIMDVLKSLNFHSYSDKFSYDKWCERLGKLFELVRSSHLIELNDIETRIPEQSEFVPGSLKRPYPSKYDWPNDTKDGGSFGEILS
jgi:hypothetical protein